MNDYINKTSKDAAKAWLREVVRKHVPANAKNYTPLVFNDEASISPSFGFQFDPKPFEGKVVDMNDTWILVKEGRKNTFLVALKSILSEVPGLEDKVIITPYARKRFDGNRLDTPKIEDSGRGYVSQVINLGERVSYLPIDKESVKSMYLSDLIQQVEQLPDPSRMRTIAQMLIDAGGSKEPVTFCDPDDDNVIKTPPMLRFRVDTQKHNGYIKIIYDRGIDYYVIELSDIEDKQAVYKRTDICFDELGDVIAELIDDGSWKIANVKILNRKNKGRTAA